jgi:nifR3 family TIM-barrel protein
MSGAKFMVGDIPIQSDLILAPMDGYSDYPFRSICRHYGSGMSYTAFVSAIDLLQGNQAALHALTYSPRERPVVFQIFDNDEQRLLEAAVQIEQLQPDIIDINMGCSIRRVSGRGAGAGLLRDPDKVGRIMAQLSTSLSVPVSAKIRLGWDDRELNYLEVVDAITKNGGALIAVHGRTRSQGYKGKANWDAIAEIKMHTNVPVIGNGDVRSLDDIDNFLEHTACDGIMIGRGAVGNPWIFSRRKRAEIHPDEVKQVVLEQFKKMLSYHGEHQGMLRFRKHLKAYLTHFHISPDRLRSLLTCTEVDTLRQKIDALFIDIQEESVGALQEGVGDISN